MYQEFRVGDIIINKSTSPRPVVLCRLNSIPADFITTQQVFFFTPSMLWSQGPNWCSREGKAQTPVNIDFTLLLWVLGSAVLGNWWSLTSNWHHFHNISVCIDCLAPTRCADLWPFVVFQLLILSRQLSLSQRFIYACYSCTLQAF